MSIPNLIPAGLHKDERGTVAFFNDFDFTFIKRFYVIEHPDTEIVRAWQAHQKEQKWFYVVSGSFKIVLVKPDDWQNPSPDLVCREYNLSSSIPQVLHIPGGFASGLKALENHSRLMVFSDATLQESAADNYRFNKHFWYSW